MPEGFPYTRQATNVPAGAEANPQHSKGVLDSFRAIALPGRNLAVYRAF
jgi:hypothetical protein